jgi:hypothetical protein
MAGTEKVSDQIKGIKNAFDIKTHVFMNKLIVGLKEELQKVNPDVVVVPHGKKMSEEAISLVLKSEVICDNEEEAEQTKTKLIDVVKSINSPSDIESLIKGK